MRFVAARRSAANRVFLSALKPLSVGLFFLTIFAGLFGSQDAASNFAPTFFWISFWVGMSFFTALVGNVWPLVSPWKVLFECMDGLVRRAGLKNGLNLGLRYPSGLGAWPAVALHEGFVWFEILFAGSSVPANIAGLLVL